MRSEPKKLHTKPHKSAAERVTSLEREGRDNHSGPVQNDGPRARDDSQEKQNSSPSANPKRRDRMLPG